MVDALAPHWVHAGPEVFVGGRGPSHARALRTRLGGGSGTLRETAEFGEQCLLAVRSEGLVATLEAARSAAYRHRRAGGSSRPARRGRRQDN